MSIVNIVYVLNMRGEPLMPTKPAKARHLLEAGKAKVVRRQPFTIQLTVASGENRQSVSCGIDSGYKSIGFSCISDRKELISGEVKLDNNMSKRLLDRAMYRRSRRNRLWYREPRYDHRPKEKGWLPPSIQRRFDTHLKLIDFLGKILPITKTIIEIGAFDIQKLIDPTVKGIDYQQGDLYEYANLKSFLLTREQAKCQLCGKKHKKWRSHHIIPREQGGTDRPNNMALLGEDCHERLHKNNLEGKLQKNRQFKDSAFMNIIRKKIIDLGFDTVYGYETYVDRNKLGLEKSHVNDAFVIAGGSNEARCDSYEVIQKRKNNRCLQINRKGFKPSIRRQRYALRPMDLVKIAGKIFEVKGVHSYGKWVLLKNDTGEIIDKVISKLDNWCFHQKTLTWRSANLSLQRGRRP